MKHTTIDRNFGRQAFGDDPAAYHATRPDYPAWVFETLSDRCGLAPGTPTFEIGPGTGKATLPLLNRSANPLLAIEPDRRLAAFLRRTIPHGALRILEAPFESAPLPEAAFTLGLAATAFHWLDENAALTKVARLLRPGGWWAMVCNVFGDPNRADPFHEATKSLLEGPESPSAGVSSLPFALDAPARLAALRATQAFDNIEHQTRSWQLVLDPDQVTALYATYSNLRIRPDRTALLAELKRIAREQFAGRVTRNMVTSLYIARRT
ncbi:MAG: class I SAM-dependent methyltransferase [Acetobacteraceae bacterium]|nr:class I SAM-dependent methyltransferase [Acetobacteraceae bacterium]